MSTPPTSAARPAALHVFNASHDEALAAGSPLYYPSRAARALEADLATLPGWWAAPGDAVLVPAGTQVPPQLAESVRFVTEDELRRGAWSSVGRIEPWGWDALLRRRLRRMEAPEALLPTDEDLERVRGLSSRSLACALLRRLRAELPNTVGESTWCATTDELRAAVAAYGSAMVKAPWSGSGRGVFRMEAMSPAPLWQRAARIVEQQGGVVAEPYYTRLADMALEFEADGRGGLTYAGLSLFRTSPTGAYAGNVLAPEAALRAALPPAVAQGLDALQAALGRTLGRALTGYSGPLGVDLMAVSRPSGEAALHPCVEVNLRQTMGRAALLLRPRFAEGGRGLFALRRPEAPAAGTTILTLGATQMEAVVTEATC